jgi:hypothetical protein
MWIVGGGRFFGHCGGQCKSVKGENENGVNGEINQTLDIQVLEAL